MPSRLRKVVVRSRIASTTPLLPLMLAMIGLTLAYVGAAEIAKKFFYARMGMATK